MKKTLIILLAIFFLIILILMAIFIGVQSENKLLMDVNPEYEYYLNKNIYGTELATLINRAVDNNKRKEIPIDSDGFYIDNGKDSISINIKMMDVKDVVKMEKIFSLRYRTIYHIF